MCSKEFFSNAYYFEIIVLDAIFNFFLNIPFWSFHY